MKRNSKIVALCLSLMLLFASCVPAMAENEEVYVAVILKSFTGDFWKNVELGARTAGEDLGIKVTVDGPDTEISFDQQVSMVENAINKGADVIALAPHDGEALVPVMEKAFDAGIKILTLNSPIKSDKVGTHVSTDNVKAGELAGQALAEAMGGKGKYAIIGAVEGVETIRQRSEGAANYIKENYPDMELISIQYTDNDMNKTLQIANDLITANPDIGGIFSNNETTTIGTVTTLLERGKVDQIKHVGFDATEQTTSYISQGITDAVVTQRPFDMGYLAVQFGLELYQGKTLDAYYDTGCILVTKDNIQDAEIQKILYPEQ